jgi:hypothetical protein
MKLSHYCTAVKSHTMKRHATQPAQSFSNQAKLPANCRQQATEMSFTCQLLLNNSS